MHRRCGGGNDEGNDEVDDQGKKSAVVFTAKYPAIKLNVKKSSFCE